ncbi:MAG TPA: hypothetical protein VFA18_22305 [Gemmataceae bacterium]|nr:hypothetical protein [Gemmataceae bacterium]
MLCIFGFVLGCGSGDSPLAPAPPAVVVTTPTPEVLGTLVGKRVVIEGKFVEGKSDTYLESSGELIAVDIPLGPSPPWLVRDSRVQVTGTLQLEQEFGRTGFRLSEPQVRVLSKLQDEAIPKAKKTQQPRIPAEVCATGIG